MYWYLVLQIATTGRTDRVMFKVICATAARVKNAWLDILLKTPTNAPAIPPCSLNSSDHRRWGPSSEVPD